MAKFVELTPQNYNSFPHWVGALFRVDHKLIVTGCLTDDAILHIEYGHEFDLRHHTVEVMGMSELLEM